VPPSILASDKNKPAPSGARKTKIALNSGDTVYEEIRDLNFARVGPLLNKRAKKISEEYDVCGWMVHAAVCRVGLRLTHGRSRCSAGTSWRQDGGPD
jgi:hypothetical protein